MSCGLEDYELDILIHYSAVVASTLIQVSILKGITRGIKGNLNRDFNITEIAEESDISRQAAIPVVKKFLQWNLLKIDSKRGNANYYKVNEDSDLIKAFREINNSIITRMLGEDGSLSGPAQPIPACNNTKSAQLGMPLPS